MWKFVDQKRPIFRNVEKKYGLVLPTSAGATQCARRESGGKNVWTILSLPRRMRGQRTQIVGLAALIVLSASVLYSEQAAAQAVSRPNAQLPAKSCKSLSGRRTGGAPSMLLAVCGGQGLALGPVTEFEVIESKALRATLVDVRFRSRRRVLMLTVGEDGAPVLEDLTGRRRVPPATEQFGASGVELSSRHSPGTGDRGARSRGRHRPREDWQHQSWTKDLSARSWKSATRPNERQSKADYFIHDRAGANMGRETKAGVAARLTIAAWLIVVSLVFAEAPASPSAAAAQPIQHRRKRR